MTPEQAVFEGVQIDGKLLAMDIWDLAKSDRPHAYEEIKRKIREAFHAQRAEAVAEFRERILSIIDSQTHSSELGDAYRHIRQLIGMLPPAQEGEG